MATNVVLNSKGKEGVLDLPANGNYQIDMKQTGFIDKTIMITVNATMDNEEIERIVVMIPDLPPEETQILMSWETDPPADVDIYVAAINNADDSICVVYFDNRNCPGAAAQQIRDNAEGGDNGPETVSLTNSSVSSQFTYLLAANDYDFESNGDSFLISCTTFNIQNNIQSYDFQKLSASSINITHQHYFFGCLTFQSNGEFTAIDAPSGIFFNGDSDAEWQTLKNTYC